MIVTDVRCHYVKPRWLFIEVETDDGTVGWGEAAVEPWQRTIGCAIAELGETLVGRDPRRVEDNWHVLTRGRFYKGGPILGAAVAAIDTALWDINGQICNAPIHELLGGPTRERVRAYSWITLDEHGDEEISPEQFAAHARGRVQAGFTAVKAGYGQSETDALDPIETTARITEITEFVQTIRAAIGPTVDLALDLHGRCSRALAKTLARELEPVELLFLEEPVLPEYTEAFREIATLTRTPIATGERIYNARDFIPILETGVSVLQPDVANAGGITELVRIADLAATYDASVAPHCAGGPISLAASLQIACASTNFLIQEQGVDYYDPKHFEVGMLDYVTDPSTLQLEDGYFKRPSKPGLGIEVDRDAVLEHAWEPRSWHPPLQRRADGSYADW